MRERERKREREKTHSLSIIQSEITARPIVPVCTLNNFDPNRLGL
jgi:hypothetical protein